MERIKVGDDAKEMFAAIRAEHGVRGMHTTGVLVTGLLRMNAIDAEVAAALNHILIDHGKCLKELPEAEGYGFKLDFTPIDQMTLRIGITCTGCEGHKDITDYSKVPC